MPKEVGGFKLRRAGKPVKEGFVPAEFKTANFKIIPSLVKAKAEAMAEKARPLNSNDPDPEDPSSTPEGGTLSAITRVKVAGKEVDALLDTGASVNLINLNALYELDRFPELERYDGRLETADGRQMAVVGRARVRIVVGAIDEEVNFLVMHDVNPTIILGLAFMNNHKSNLDFNTKQFWTGPGEGSIVGFRVEQIRRIRGLRETEPEEPSKNSNADQISGDGVEEQKPEVSIGHEEIPHQQSDDTENQEADRVRVVQEPRVETTPTTCFPTLEQDVEKILALSAENVTGREREVLAALVTEYRDVFALNDDELGCTDVAEHHIETGDSDPIKIPPHRIAPAKLPIVQQEVEDMLKRGVIQHSNSPYSAPIVLARKKDGSWRFCVDYRRLNEVTVKDAFPIPKIEQTFDALNGAKLFSTLDLASGYWQVPVAPEDRHKTAFVTPDGGLYEYVRMPFGLTNAPGTFQRLMNNLFAQYIYKGVLIFLDDVLLYSGDVDQHMQNLRITFETLREANLRLKPKKCKFFQKQVDYLGHTIQADGTSPDPGKVEAVKEWPVPKNVTDVRSFVGFCSYYRRFIRNFAEIARPLHAVTKKNARFEWNEDCQVAFERLKLELTTAPMLQYPDYKSPFVVDTDASNVSLGAVLSNVIDGDERPLVFASRVLSKTESMYSTTKREALAVVQALKWFRPYIWGTEFVVRTDHASLRWLFRQNADGQTFRMLQTLQEYNFKVVHRSGDKHGNADGLSRMSSDEPEWLPGKKEELMGSCPEPLTMEQALKELGASDRVATVAEVTSPEEAQITWKSSPDDISKAQWADPAIRAVLEWADVKNKPHQTELGTRVATQKEAVSLGEEALAYWNLWRQLFVKNGLLYRHWASAESGQDQVQLIVPFEARKEILEQLHSSQMSGGHFALEKTLLRIRQRFWWPSMRRDVEKRISWCVPCAARSVAGKKNIAELQPRKVGIRFHTVAADILGPVTKATKTGAKYILAMTDCFTKFVVTVPLVKTEAQDVAEAIVTGWILHFGVPDCLHTDQGTNFGSRVIQEMCQLLKIDKTRTSPYHPQGNGQVERHNRVIADMVSKYCSDNPQVWDEVLPYLNFVYNTTVHRTTRATPFALVYGQECQYPIDLFYPRPHDELMDRTDFVDDLDRKFHEAHSAARSHLGVNQERQKDRYHKKVYGRNYAEGEKVWLMSPHKAKSRKFYLPWDGPWEILEQTSEVNYKIAKKGKEDKWKIVHFNMLKPFVSEPVDERPSRPNPYRSKNFFDDVDEEDLLDEPGHEDPSKSAGIAAKTEAETRRIAGQTVRKYDRLKRDLWLDQDFHLGPMFEEESETGRKETLDESTRVTGCSYPTPTRADKSTQQVDEATHTPGNPVDDAVADVTNPEPLDDTQVEQPGDQQRYPQRSRKPTQRFGIDE